MDTNLAAYYFHQGTNFKSHDFMGCHTTKSPDGFSYTFRVWSPNADEVIIIGDFCDWTSGIPMERITEKGIYEAVIKSKTPLEGTSYKYIVKQGEKAAKSIYFTIRLIFHWVSGFVRKRKGLRGQARTRRIDRNSPL